MAVRLADHACVTHSDFFGRGALKAIKLEPDTMIDSSSDLPSSHNLSDDAVVGGFEIRTEPMMSPAAISFLRERLSASKCYLEYGGGGSTRMAARLGVPRIFSVESDVVFARAVEDAVSSDNSSSVVTITTPPLGETGRWGHPVGTGAVHQWPSYPLAIWDLIRLEGAQPDLIVVDGRFRVACFLASLLWSQPGTMIIFDDYTGRRRKYGVVERYAKPISSFEMTTVFQTPANFDPRAVVRDLVQSCLSPA
jgi:hypothetical protein